MNLPTSLPSSNSPRATSGLTGRRTPDARLHGRLALLRDLVSQGLYRVPTELLAERLLRDGVLAHVLTPR